MTKEERRDRIRNEIIMDAYGDEEVNMSWYYHFEENLVFPFLAYVHTEYKNGNKGMISTEVVKIVSSTHEEILFGGFYSGCEAMVKFKITDISSIIDEEENIDILNDWLFWSRLEFLKKYKR